MIKTPVSYNDRFNRVEDADGGVVMYYVSEDIGNETVKRINMHYELVKSLQDLIEIVGELEECDARRISKSFRWICEIHQNAISVLEKCK